MDWQDSGRWTVEGLDYIPPCPLRRSHSGNRKSLTKSKSSEGEEGSRKSMEAEAEEEVGVSWIGPSEETDWREKCESESEKITPSYLEVPQRVSLMIGSPLPPPTQMISCHQTQKKSTLRFRRIEDPVLHRSSGYGV